MVFCIGLSKYSRAIVINSRLQLQFQVGSSEACNSRIIAETALRPGKELGVKRQLRLRQMGLA
jgi:hypothetical protein